MPAPNTFDPSVMLFHDDPYPIYHHFRKNDPTHRSTVHSGWYLFRYEDARRLLTDERFISDKGTPNLDNKSQPLRQMLAMRRNWMMERDPPAHTRLRSPVARVFTPQRVSELTPRFESWADQLLDACLARPEFDAIQDYALPFVRGAMAEISGIPDQLARRFSRGVRDIELVSTSRQSIERMARAVHDLGKLFEDLLSERRARPTGDLISAIAGLDDDTSSWEERIATCILIISAGAGVTVGAIGNSVQALLQDPESCAKFRSGEVAPADALEELLRFDPTSVGLVRIAREDVQAFGVTVRKGEQVVALLGSANRDPEVFEEPDRLDLTRRPVAHLTFGHGVHFCLGASLARAQMGVALNRLFERAPEVQRTQDPLEWRGGLQRALSTMRVRCA